MTDIIDFHPKLIKVFDYSDEIKEILEIDFYGFGQLGGRKGKKSNEVSEEDRERNLKRVKKNIRRLAFSNDLGQVHLVLTYKQNMQDVEKSDLHFKEFMKSIHKVHSNLKYLATREFQKRGAVHYHVLINQRVNIKKVSSLWKHGYISLVQHKNKLKAVMYVMKYITKELDHTILVTKNGHTKKLYLSSKGLKRELVACTSGFLINTPEEYKEYCTQVENLINILEAGWDLSFIIELPLDEKVIQGRSILRCAANNY